MLCFLPERCCAYSHIGHSVMYYGAGIRILAGKYFVSHEVAVKVDPKKKNEKEISNPSF